MKRNKKETLIGLGIVSVISALAIYFTKKYKETKDETLKRPRYLEYNSNLPNPFLLLTCDNSKNTLGTDHWFTVDQIKTKNELTRALNFIYGKPGEIFYQNHIPAQYMIACWNYVKVKNIMDEESMYNIVANYLDQVWANEVKEEKSVRNQQYTIEKSNFIYHWERKGEN